MTANMIDYNQILDDVKTLISTKVTSASVPFKKVDTNLMVRDFVFNDMPLCDVRLGTMDPEVLAGQSYYSSVAVDLEIAAFSLSSKDKAARIANELLAKSQRAIVENPHFGAVWDAVVLGHVDFLTAESGKEGFAASVVAQVVIKLYADR
jgi:hypothetical protein